MSIADIKKLYALSAGKCNICKKGLFEDSVHIGEMAHVIAKKPRGARGDEPLDGDINGYTNLILLCANHHTEVDQNPKKYTVEVLHRIKSTHEHWVEQSLLPVPGRDDDVQSLRYLMKYVPFTQLASCVYHLPNRFDSEIFSPGDMMEPFCIDRPHAYPFKDPDLQKHFSAYIEACKRLSQLLNGETNQKSNYVQEIYPHNERLFGRINSSDLTFEERKLVSDKVTLAKETFEVAYHELIRFLRTAYPEVELNSYESA